MINLFQFITFVWKFKEAVFKRVVLNSLMSTSKPESLEMKRSPGCPTEK